MLVTSAGRILTISWGGIIVFQFLSLRNRSVNRAYDRIEGIDFRPWILKFSNFIEFRSFRGSPGITDKTETKKGGKGLGFVLHAP